MAVDLKALAELGMPTELAKKLGEKINTGTLQIGTSGTTAMAGNRTPTVSIRGGVLQATAQADSVAATVGALVTDFNALLAKLRTAGVIASS